MRSISIISKWFDGGPSIRGEEVLGPRELKIGKTVYTAIKYKHHSTDIPLPIIESVCLFGEHYDLSDVRTDGNNEYTFKDILKKEGFIN